MNMASYLHNIPHLSLLIFIYLIVFTILLLKFLSNSMLIWVDNI